MVYTMDMTKRVVIPALPDASVQLLDAIRAAYGWSYGEAVHYLASHWRHYDERDYLEMLEQAGRNRRASELLRDVNGGPVDELASASTPPAPRRSPGRRRRQPR